jgi:hypothetical protein
VPKIQNDDGFSTILEGKNVELKLPEVKSTLGSVNVLNQID